MPARLGANAIITYNGKILLEKRRDCDIWGLVGGGVKKRETPLQAITREIYEELGLRISSDKLTKLSVYGEPGRIAAYRDGSVWRMVIVVYALDLPEEPQMRISEESRELRFFNKEELKNASNKGIIDEKVIALGGVTFDKIAYLEDLGFGGVAMIGGIYNTNALTSLKTY
jgi:8-oxo-dGTP pyrophosphatase MutT (NUDIX family)